MEDVSTPYLGKLRTRSWVCLGAFSAGFRGIFGVEVAREYGILIAEIAPQVEVCTLTIANAFRKIERRMRSD